MFVDPDDFIHPDTLSICDALLVKYNPDLLEFSYAVVKSNDITQISTIEPIAINGSSNILRLSDNIAWNKVYKTEIIRKHNLRFKYRLFEDTHFTIEYILQCKSAIKISQPLYNYFVNTQSLSHKYKEDYFAIMTERALDVYRILCENNLISESESYLNNSFKFMFNKLLTARCNSDFAVYNSKTHSSNVVEQNMGELVSARNKGWFAFLLTSIKYVDMKHIAKMFLKKILKKA